MRMDLGINSLLQLWQLLQDEYGYKDLLTIRSNQDCPEILFGILHAKGAGYDHLDPKTFTSAFA